MDKAHRALNTARDKADTVAVTVQEARVHSMDKAVTDREARDLSMVRADMEIRVRNTAARVHSMDKVREATVRADMDKVRSMSKEAVTRVHRMNRFSDRVASMNRDRDLSDKECTDRDNQKEDMDIRRDVSRNGKEANMDHAATTREWDLLLPMDSREAMIPIATSRTMVMKAAADMAAERE